VGFIAETAHKEGRQLLGPELGEVAIVADHAGDGEGAGRSWGPLKSVARRQAALPISTPAVQYALSVFEGLKAYRDPSGGLHLFRARSHAARLRRSAERLCLPDVPEELFLRACARAVEENASMVPAGGGGQLYLRPTLFGNEEYLGVRTARAHQFVVVVTSAADLGLRTVRLRTERDFIRAAPGGLGAAKTGANYAGALLAQKRARAEGFDDVLWLDAVRRRDVGEAGTMNVFFAFQDRVVTPALDGTILPGITRDSCLTFLREWGTPAEERTLSIDEIEARARKGELLEAFGVSTALRLAAIGEIVHGSGSIRPGGGSLAKRLRDALADVQEGRCADPHHWREPIRLASAAAAASPR
jgi:branched-chain amino acid aminotransferase